MKCPKCKHVFDETDLNVIDSEDTILIEKEKHKVDYTKKLNTPPPGPEVRRIKEGPDSKNVLTIIGVIISCFISICLLTNTVHLSVVTIGILSISLGFILTAIIVWLIKLDLKEKL